MFSLSAFAPALYLVSAGEEQKQLLINHMVHLLINY